MDLDLRKLPSPYYRVSTRAIVLDDQQRLLVMENKDGEIELPGGGLEYGEDYQTCLTRELEEELGVTPSDIGEFVGLYQGKGSREIMYLRLAFRVALPHYNFQVSEMKRAWFVTREELSQLDLRPAAEYGLLEYVDKIWSEK